MKRITLILATLIGLTTAALAGDVKPVPTATTLTAEELALVETLEEELTINVEQILAEIAAKNTIEAIEVFDAAGNVICSQEGEIDFTQIPQNAEKLMTEGNTQYYIVAE